MAASGLLSEVLLVESDISEIFLIEPFFDAINKVIECFVIVFAVKVLWFIWVSWFSRSKFIRIFNLL